MSKFQLPSCKFTSHKHSIYNRVAVENILLSFLVFFIFLNLTWLLSKITWTSYQYLLRCNFFGSRSSRQKKQMAFWNFFENWMKVRLLCLLLLNWKKQINYSFSLCVICTNTHFSVADWSFIIYFLIFFFF